LLHSLKALLEIVSTESGMTSEVIPSHLAKASLPMDLREVGKVIDVKNHSF